MTPEEKYYILRHSDSKEEGPYSKEQIMIMWNNREIGEKTLYAVPGMNEWKSVRLLIGVLTWRDNGFVNDATGSSTVSVGSFFEVASYMVWFVALICIFLAVLGERYGLIQTSIELFVFGAILRGLDRLDKIVKELVKLNSKK